MEASKGPVIIIDNTVAGDPPKFIDCKVVYGGGSVQFRLELGFADRPGAWESAYAAELKQLGEAIVSAASRDSGIVVRPLKAH